MVRALWTATLKPTDRDPVRQAPACRRPRLAPQAQVGKKADKKLKNTLSSTLGHATFALRFEHSAAGNGQLDAKRKVALVEKNG